MTYSEKLDQISAETKESIQLRAGDLQQPDLNAELAKLDAEIQGMRTSIYIIVGNGETHLDEGRTFYATSLL